METNAWAAFTFALDFRNPRRNVVFSRSARCTSAAFVCVWSVPLFGAVSMDVGTRSLRGYTRHIYTVTKGGIRRVLHVDGDIPHELRHAQLFPGDVKLAALARHRKTELQVPGTAFSQIGCGNEKNAR